MIAVPYLEDLPDLFRDGYASPSDHFGKERYLFLMEFDRHLRHRR
jgi:hypothetical protein